MHIRTSNKIHNTSTEKCLKRNFFYIKNFYDVLLPFYYLAKVFGYFAFTLLPTQSSSPNAGKHDKTASTKHQYRTATLDVILFIINVVINFGLLYCERMMLQITTDTKILDIGPQLVLIYSTCITILSSILVFMMRRKVVSAIVKMHMVDQEVYKYLLCFNIG